MRLPSKAAGGSFRAMKIAALMIGVAMAWVMSAWAAEGWVETGAKIDEVVAESGMLAPTSALRPLAAEIPFVAFRYPHVDEQQNVTFIADDPAYSDGGENHGIYRSLAAGGDLIALVRAGETEVPGAGGARFTYVRGLQTEGVRTERMVFHSGDTGGEWGWYRWEDDAMRTIVRTGETVLPGESGPVTEVGYGNVRGDFVLVEAETDGVETLALFDSESGMIRSLLRADGTVAMPGQPGATFRYLSPQNWLDGRDVVFRGARVENPHQGSSRARGDRGIYGWFDVGLGNPAAFDPAELVRIADWSTEVPLMPDANFTDLDSAPVDEGLVGFAGSGAGFRGVYFYDARAPEPELRVIADTRTGIDSCFPGAFTSFGMYTTVTERRIVFLGYAGDFVGVFCYQVDQDALYLLADNRSPLEGKTIEDFELSGRFFSGGRFAVTAMFSDDSSGVYLASIPEDSLKLMRQ